MYGSLLGIAPSLDVGRDVLEYYDRIIHDHTDGDGERAEGYDVQGIARHQ